MTKQWLLSLAASTIIFSGGMASAAFAQATDISGHPRVNEIDQRLQNQQNRIDSGVNNGSLNATQAMHDENRDAKVAQELSADQAKNGGHITKAEQKKMNRQLNHNSRRIHRQKIKTVRSVTPAH